MTWLPGQVKGEGQRGRWAPEMVPLLELKEKSALRLAVFLVREEVRIPGQRLPC